MLHFKVASAWHATLKCMQAQTVQQQLYSIRPRMDHLHCQFACLPACLPFSSFIHFKIGRDLG